MRTALHWARCIVAPLTLVCNSAGAESLIELPTRDGVTQSFLLAAPGAPRAVALLFPGGDGSIDLSALRDRFDLARGNFLVRARKHLVESGVATALLTVPSDQTQGMHDSFRLGEAHAADIKAVVTELRRLHPALPVFLVGTSRGTVSAAAAGRTLDAEIAGIVLTATVTRATGLRRPNPGLSDFDFARLKTKVLLVHHRDDGCIASPYSGAQALAGRFALISVSGGTPARSEPCQALSPHGFIGHEAKTMQAIAAWMLGQPHPSVID